MAFGGITNALIPLYAVGVFTSFTLSQAGMVRHHLRERLPGLAGRHGGQRRRGGRHRDRPGSSVLISKFTSGAWVPIVVIPAIILLFKGIHRHYSGSAGAWQVPPDGGRRRA